MHCIALHCNDWTQTVDLNEGTSRLFLVPGDFNILWNHGDVGIVYFLQYDESYVSTGNLFDLECNLKEGSELRTTDLQCLLCTDTAGARQIFSVKYTRKS